MVALRWLALASALLVACGDDDQPGAISDPGSNPGTPAGQGGAGAGGKAGAGGSGSGVGAPGDPPPGSSLVGLVLDPADPKLAWKGYVDGSDNLSTVLLGAYYDPDGEKGIRALLVTEGQADCGPCIKEAKDLQEKLPSKWNALGIKVVQLVVADYYGKPASTKAVLDWKTKIKASWTVAADPDFTFSQEGSNPYPIQVIIDPRTFTIVDRIEGYHQELPALEALAEKNQ